MTEQQLLKKAIEFFSESESKKLMIAASGTVNDLLLIHAASLVFGHKFAMVITADTEFVDDDHLEIIRTACSEAQLDHILLPVMLPDECMEGAPSSPKYKEQIFLDMFTEAWLHGYDTIVSSCTSENINKDGNDVLLNIDGIVFPFLSDTEVIS